MKASFRFILAALAATAALVGCTKEITPSFENDKVNPEGTRVIAVSFAPQTKTELDGFQPKFANKDSILISNGEALDTCEVKVDGKGATITTNLTGPLTAVYPYKAAGMNDNNHNLIDTVLVSTEQDGTFASANICMARMTGENEESLSFENKTAVFCIKPAAGASSEYVEIKAEGFNIANDYPEGSTYTTCNTIHVAPITTDSVYVSILVPNGLKVNNLKFSDGTQEKAITTGARAAEAIAAGALYTVTNENWTSPEAALPDGALKGLFSVSATKKVHFSKGNLYADGSYALHFEDAQWKSTPASAGSKDASHVSHFTWSDNITSAVSDSNSGDNLFCDESHKVSVDGGDAIYYVLSKDEWTYLFNNHTMGWASVNGKTGYVIAPDGFTGNLESSYADDAALASAGNLVFLPAAGFRDGSDVLNVGSYGFYWSSTASGSDSAYRVYFRSSNVNPGDIVTRNNGYSVRLVTNVSAAPVPEQSLVLGPDMIIMKMKGSESKPGIDNVTYPWIEYVNPNSTLDDGTAEVLYSSRWTNLDPATGDIGDGTNWIRVTGKNGSVNSPVINPQLGTYFIFTVQNIYGMQVFATGSASGSAADGNYLKLTATSDDGEVIEASTTPGTIYGKGDSSDFCTINLNPKKSYEVKAEAAVKAIQITGIKLINEIP